MYFIGRPNIDPSGVFFPGHLFASTDAELPGEHASSDLQRFATAARGQSTQPCGLASALRDRSIHWALVLDLPGARGFAARLTPSRRTPPFPPPSCLPTLPPLN